MTEVHPAGNVFQVGNGMQVHFVMTEPTLTQCLAWRRLWQLLLQNDGHLEREEERGSPNSNDAPRASGNAAKAMSAGKPLDEAVSEHYDTTAQLPTQ